MAESCFYLQLDGVDGECQDDGYKDHLDIQSFSWGATNSSSYSAGAGPGVGTGQVHNMSFNKFMCQGSPTVLEYYTVDMEKVIITSYHISASGGAQLPMESFSLDFVVVKPNYVKQEDDGSGKDNHGFGWNVSTNSEA